MTNTASQSHEHRHVRLLLPRSVVTTSPPAARPPARLDPTCALFPALPSAGPPIGVLTRPISLNTRQGCGTLYPYSRCWLRATPAPIGPTRRVNTQAARCTNVTIAAARGPASPTNDGPTQTSHATVSTTKEDTCWGSLIAGKWKGLRVSHYPCGSRSLGLTQTGQLHVAARSARILKSSSTVASTDSESAVEHEPVRREPYSNRHPGSLVVNHHYLKRSGTGTAGE